MQSCAANSWLRPSRVWHWWPLRGSSTSCQQQQPGLAPLEKKGSCHLLHLKPKKLLPISQLVSMGTRAKRELKQPRLLGEGGGVRQTVSRMINPAAQVGRTPVVGIATGSSSEQEQPCRQQGMGTLQALDPWHVGRPFVQSGPLEGQRPVPRCVLQPLH